MGENKGQTIFLSVIGIATLLVAIIGATFAYFTTTMTDSGTAKDGSQVTTAILNPVTFQVTPGEALTDIYPGADFKDTTVVVSSTGIPKNTTLSYVCTVSLSSTAGTPGDGTTGKALAPSDIEWSATSAGSDTAVNTSNLEGTTQFKGSLTNDNTSDTWTIKAKFVNTNTNQNELQGATAKIQVACALQSEVQYYSGHTTNAAQ